MLGGDKFEKIKIPIFDGDRKTLRNWKTRFIKAAIAKGLGQHFSFGYNLEVKFVWRETSANGNASRNILEDTRESEPGSFIDVNPNIEGWQNKQTYVVFNDIYHQQTFKEEDVVTTVNGLDVRNPSFGRPLIGTEIHEDHPEFGAITFEQKGVNTYWKVNATSESGINVITRAHQRLWLSNEAVAQQLILESVSSLVSKLFKPTDSASEMYLFVIKHYSSIDSAMIKSNREQLQNLEYVTFESFTETAKLCLNNLIELGKPFEEDLVCDILTPKLPDVFDNVVAMFDNETHRTFDKLYDKLLAYKTKYPNKNYGMAKRGTNIGKTHSLQDPAVNIQGSEHVLGVENNGKKFPRWTCRVHRTADHKFKDETCIKMSAEYFAKKDKDKEKSNGTASSGTPSNPNSLNPPLNPSVKANVVVNTSYADFWYSESSVSVLSVNPHPKKDHRMAVDSGCHSSMAHVQAKFQDMRKRSAPLMFQSANSKSKAMVEQGIGSYQLDVCVDMNDPENTKGVLIPDVCYVPELTTNLLSVSQLERTKGISTVFTNGRVLLFKERDLSSLLTSVHQPVGIGYLESDGLYWLGTSPISTQTCNAVKYGPRMTTELYQEWHQRCGHAGPQVIRKILALANYDWSQFSTPHCDGCAMGMLTRKPSVSSSSPPVAHFLDVVAADNKGPIHPATPSGKRYLLMFKDKKTKLVKGYLLKNKSESISCYRKFKARMQTQYGLSIKVFQTDRGGEFRSKAFISELEADGTIPHPIPAGHHQMNGMIEIENREIFDMALAALFAAQLPLCLWGEAVMWAIHVRNRIPRRSLDWKSPIEMLTGLPVDISYFRRFGSKCFVHFPKEDSPGLHYKAVEGRMVGFEDGAKAYRILIPGSPRVVVSNNVAFDESIIGEFTVDPSLMINSPFITDDPLDSESLLDLIPLHDIYVSTGVLRPPAPPLAATGGGEIVPVEVDATPMEVQVEVNTTPMDVEGHPIETHRNKFEVLEHMNIPENELHMNKVKVEDYTESETISAHEPQIPPMPKIRDDANMCEQRDDLPTLSRTSKENPNMEKVIKSILSRSSTRKIETTGDSRTWADLGVDSELAKKLQNMEDNYKSLETFHQNYQPNKRVKFDSTEENNAGGEAKYQELEGTGEQSKSQRKSTRTTRPVERLGFWVGSVKTCNVTNHGQYPGVEYVLNVTIPQSTKHNVPKSHKQVEQSAAREHWIEAEKRELKSFEDLNVYKWVKVEDVPNDEKIHNSIWVYTVKEDVNGNIIKYKARIVADGRTHTADETFSPTLRVDSLKACCSEAAISDMDIIQMDVDTAFLNADLDKRVYVWAPEGYSRPGWCWEVTKAMYGLVNSPRLWNKLIDKTMKECGFQVSPSDPCVYFKKYQKSLVIITLYVDDLFIFARKDKESQKMRHILISKIEERFKMKNLGNLKYGLGIQFKVEDGNVKLYQTKYIEDCLKKFNLEAIHPVRTPMVVDEPLSKVNLDEEDLSMLPDKYPYRAMVGTLGWLANTTRPDIAYAHSVLSRYVQKYSHRHLTAAIRVFQYLKKTKEYGLVYQGENKDEVVIYADASFANCPDTFRSALGFVTIRAGASISHSSHRHDRVTDSTCETEYISLSEAGKHAMHTRNLLADLGVFGENQPINVIGDNMGAIALASNHLIKKNSKHVHRKYHWIREAIENKEIELFYTNTNQMVADICTKELAAPKFESFRQDMGVLDCSIPIVKKSSKGSVEHQAVLGIHGCIQCATCKECGTWPANQEGNKITKRFGEEREGSILGSRGVKENGFPNIP